MPFGAEKLWCGILPDGEKKMITRLFVLTEFTNVTDAQTDGRTPHDDV